MLCSDLLAVADRPGDADALLVQLDGAARFAEAERGGAEIAEAPTFSCYPLLPRHLKSTWIYTFVL